ncbi:MAG: hypothetical protein ABI769_18785 [Pseudomonadota bacterium]
MRIKHCVSLAVALIAFAGAAFADDDYLASIGGAGGGVFATRCPTGSLLHGVEIRGADDVDAIRLVCVYAQGPAQFSAAAADPTWRGGDGGVYHRVVCPDQFPIVFGLDVHAEGVDTIIVNDFSLHCGWATATQPASVPTNELPGFDGPSYMPETTRYGMGFGTSGRRASGTSGRQFCPPGRVAVGLRGRSGIWLDGMGLMCGEPTTYLTLGRANTGSAPSGPPMSLCDRARDARARNSPAAADLEEQCRRSQPPVKSLGRIGHPVGSPHISTTAQETPTMTSAAPPAAATTAATPRAALAVDPPICAAARNARARNSPAAPNLEAQCRAAGGTP